MDKNEGCVRKEVDDDETPKQSPPQPQQQQQQESPSRFYQEDFPQLTGPIQSKKELRNSHLKAPKANLSTHVYTPKQSPQINKAWSKDQRLLHVSLQDSYLSKVTTTTHGSSTCVNVTPEPEPDSASFGLPPNWSPTDHDFEISQGSLLPRRGNQLPVLKLLASGVEIPSEGTLSANSSCTPKASAEPFTLSPRQASGDHHKPLFPEDRSSEAFALEFPKISREIQSKKELRNAHLKTPTANLSNTSTHGSSPSVHVPGKVTQESDLSDEITGQDQDHSALDDKVQ